MLIKILDYVKKYRFRISMVIVNAVISILPIFLIGMIVRNMVVSENIKKIDLAVDTSFNQIKSQHDIFFNNIKQLSQYVFFSDNIMEVLENDATLENDESIFLIRDHFSSIMPFNSNIKDVYLVTSRNRQAGTNSITIGEKILSSLEQNRSDEGEFSFMVSSALLDGSYGDIVAWQNIRFKNSLRYAGVGVIILDKSEFMKSLESVNQIEKMDVVVSDSNGSLIAASKKTNIAAMQYVLDNHTQNNSFFKLNGEEYLLRCETLALTGWKINAFVPVSEIYKASNRINNLILMTTLLVLLLTVFATLYYNLSISKYIKELMKAFQKVSINDMKVRLDFGKGHEMTYISNGFNDMISKLETLTREALDTQERLYETQLQKISAELYGLQSQINSHFLYNTLGTIRGMVRTNNSEEADAMIMGLVSILRYATDKTEFVSFDSEINNIKKYIEIQNSTTRRISLKTDVSEKVRECFVHKLILQPVIENSILHGFENRHRGKILIKAYFSDDALIVKVFDNGCGIPQENLFVLNSVLENTLDAPIEEKKHIGLANIQKRLQICYGNEYGIKVKSWQNKGTVLILKLPKLDKRGNGNA